MSPKDIFHELNQTRHHDTRWQQLNIFQETPTNLTHEYWLYSDLHNIFDEQAFPTNKRMEDQVFPTNKRKEDIVREKLILPDDCDTPAFKLQHYDKIHHEFKLGYRTYKDATDLKLSRYACWSLLKHSRNNVFAQTYFLSPVIANNIDYNTLYDTASEFARIGPRQDLADAEKKLSKILASLHANIPEFYNSTSIALFNGITSEEIKEAHHIQNKKNDPIANYMGRHTLHARIAALYRAFILFNNEERTNKTHIRLNEILCNELFNERVDMINKTGRRPEQDIKTTHIDNVKKELQNAEQEFIQKYSIQNIR